jgi:hypothetical protein
MSDISLLRERLTQMADEGGHLHVDIGRARARGRRFLRLRRAAAAAGSAAMIVVVVLTAAIAGRTPTVRLSHGPAAPAAAATHPDQLIQTASFGWLPDGLAADSFVADSQNRPYFEADAGTAGTGPVIMLTDYGRGPQPALPDLPGGVPAALIPAARIHGRAAYWVTAPAAGANAQLNFELRWQYGPHRWADLQASGLAPASVTDITSTAYRIAETATFGEHSALTLPFGVAGIPASLDPRRTVLNTGPHSSALIYFAGSDLTPADSIQVSVSPTGLIRHHPGEPGSGQGPAPASRGVTTNTVIDGHPAYDTQLAGPAGAAVLLVFGVHGLDVQINAGPSALAAMPRSHNLIWVFNHMTVAGSAAR